jgi:hypothetical protein
MLIDHYNNTGTQDTEYDLENALSFYEIAEVLKAMMAAVCN